MSAVAVAFIVALGPTIAIVVSYRLTRRDTKEAAATVRTAAEGVALTAEQTAGTVNEKLDVVHNLVNDRLTKALEEAEAERAMRVAVLERLDHLEKRLAKEKP